MRTRKRAAAVLLLMILATAGCGSKPADDALGATGSSLAVPAPVESAPHFVADTGAEQSKEGHVVADWSIDVTDPLALRDASVAVIAGKVVNVEGSFVSANADIETIYTVQVEKVYAGEGLPEVISLALPGGSVTLGEYIKSLDALGLYEMKLGQKSPELLKRAGLDPDREKEARTLDPETIVSENWGVNPTSETTLAELDPDAWVFFIGGSEDGVYYGTAFDHSMAYLKDGVVYGVHPESDREGFSESVLEGK